MIYQQTDSKGFHIGQVAELAPGAIDTTAPVYDKTTEKAKWDGEQWIIDTIENWDKPPVLTQAELDRQANLERINELKQLLNDSDHKDLPNYKPKQGEDLVEVIAERDAWREEIRQLQLTLEDNV